jgi:hypothetical protein
MNELVAQGDPQEEAALRKFSDSHVIALIAYLQRLGTDKNKVWEDEAATDAAPAAEVPAAEVPAVEVPTTSPGEEAAEPPAADTASAASHPFSMEATS